MNIFHCSVGQDGYAYLANTLLARVPRRLWVIFKSNPRRICAVNSNMARNSLIRYDRWWLNCAPAVQKYHRNKRHPRDSNHGHFLCNWIIHGMSRRATSARCLGFTVPLPASESTRKASLTALEVRKIFATSRSKTTTLAPLASRAKYLPRMPREKSYSDLISSLSGFFTRSRRVGRRALIIRMRSARSVCETTTRRPES